MPQVSRIPLDTLDLVLGKLKKEETRVFLFSLLSKTERIMVAKRFTAILLLKQGLRIAEIARILNMTESTVRKFTMLMQVKNQGFDLAYRKISQEKMKQEVKEILIGLGKEAADVFMNWRIRPPNDYPGAK